MKIIDFKQKGNVVRFYLGADDLENWWGDDWNDCPYECNAEEVYDQFVTGYKDIAFDFDDIVYEPCEGEFNSPYTKEDMVKRKIPCICVLKKEHQTDDGWGYSGFKDIVGNANVVKYYFGDKMEP
ncbi:hypothetical protein FACS1894211_06740 [Clostridia bacterium]|nr:hypothetical protein FACS1894211_06740 [Clostridia bacterium]